MNNTATPEITATAFEIVTFGSNEDGIFAQLHQLDADLAFARNVPLSSNYFEDIDGVKFFAQCVEERKEECSACYVRVARPDELPK